MEIIGVIDVRGGRAVHAVAGRRSEYGPVAKVAGVRVDGDPLTLARAYVEQLGLRELYLADLGAIVDREPPSSAIADVAGVAARTWVDAGVRSLEEAHALLACGAGQVIVALETLPSWFALAEIVRAVGSDRVAFSIDLRNGTPLCPTDSDVRETSAERVAARAVDLGAASLLVIDLARVGVGNGVDLDVLRCVRAAAPGVKLVAGGGVRGAGDLDALMDAGCDAALVATALHDGRLSASDIAMRRGPVRSA